MPGPSCSALQRVGKLTSCSASSNSLLNTTHSFLRFVLRSRTSPEDLAQPSALSKKKATQVERSTKMVNELLLFTKTTMLEVASPDFQAKAKQLRRLRMTDWGGIMNGLAALSRLLAERREIANELASE